MIARLRGRLDSQGVDHAVIDIGGVGYLVHCSVRTLAALPRAGEAVDLHVETQVRAESITLYGFQDPAERSWFRILQQVQGVGARVALGVLSILAPDQLARAVVSQDKAALTQASGVGPRLAGRIVSELKDRLSGELAGAVIPPAMVAAGDAPSSAINSAVSALVNLGYGRSEAMAAVSQAAAEQGDGAPVELLIRTGLQQLANA
jgi:Holliday junction DNA helicase RuvA